MNERIKEFAKQAGIDLPDDSVYNGHIYKNAIERFAGLIIQECVQVANSHMVECEGINFGIGTKIKNHFEVRNSKREQFDKAIKAAFKDGADLSGRNTP